jgi:SAM-dependent methyltransferase
MQPRQSQWAEQWALFRNADMRQFNEWIAPATLESLRGKDVLECGCGGGHHTDMIAQHARSVTAVDLNTADQAAQLNADNDNVSFVEADLATMDLGRQFDAVICVGVIHHTDNPSATFENMFRHLKPGGTMIVWTYAAEGNGLVRYGVEPVRKALLQRLPRRALRWIAAPITLALYPIVHSIYRVPGLSFLPYYDYFANFRRLPWHHNFMNVFDKLNAPQTQFTTRATAEAWMSPLRFEPESVSLRHYAGVSYSLVGTRRA